jgi:hypothetical protein
MKFLIMQFYPASYYFVSLVPNIVWLFNVFENYKARTFRKESYFILRRQKNKRYCNLLNTVGILYGSIGCFYNGA